MPEAVYLRHVGAYDDFDLPGTVSELLQATGFRPPAGALVLVKPNLVAPRTMALACTAPQVVRAVCRHLLDSGVRVVVADSPAFGKLLDVRPRARASGPPRPARLCPTVKVPDLDTADRPRTRSQCAANSRVRTSPGRRLGGGG